MYRLEKWRTSGFGTSGIVRLTARSRRLKSRTYRERTSPRTSPSAGNRPRDFLEKTTGKESITGLREEMQKAMESGAGIYREAQALQSSIEKIFWSEYAKRQSDTALDLLGPQAQLQVSSAAAVSPALVPGTLKTVLGIPPRASSSRGQT